MKATRGQGVQLAAPTPGRLMESEWEGVLCWPATAAADELADYAVTLAAAARRWRAAARTRWEAERREDEAAKKAWRANEEAHRSQAWRAASELIERTARAIALALGPDAQASDVPVEGVRVDERALVALLHARGAAKLRRAAARRDEA